MTKGEALKMALEALEDVQEMMNTSEWFNERVQAVRTALEQPEQQPVAWWNPKKDTVSTDPVHRHNADCVPLYGHPPKIWQGLTDEEALALVAYTHPLMSKLSVARAIEAKLKEKNT